MATENLLLAFSLTLFAGLATGIGSLIALFAKKTNTRFLSVALGFSAGVMIYVSMVEIFPKAQDFLISDIGLTRGSWLAAASFFGGILIIVIIDKLIPAIHSSHERHKIEETSQAINKKSIIKDRSSLLRMGIFTAIIIALHNFPEGIATFIVTLKDPTIGIPIAIAIAIHNIPEGIAVSVPIFYATGNKKKAFTYSFLSGLAEPAGAVITYLVLMPFLNDTVFGILFALVAGIMVFISLEQLLPAAREYGEHHLSIYGLVGGMAIMALSLLLFV